MGKIEILGGSDWVPTAGNDSSSYLIGSHIMVDTGWASPTRLIMAGRDLQQYNRLLFTHMHTDHVMALPQLLLHWRVRRQCDLSGLSVYGPCETLATVFGAAWNYALKDEAACQKPALHELQPDDHFETEEYDVSVMASDHAVPGRCYRLTEKATGHSIGLSGDTRYLPGFAAFFKDVDLLVYENSFGIHPCTPENNSRCRHSSVYDAVRVAGECHAKALLLTHNSSCLPEDCVRLAQSLTDIPVLWARSGMTLYF